MTKTKTPWSTVGYLTYKRTYSRRLNENDANSDTEEFEDTVERVISATDNQLSVGFTDEEKDRLRNYLLGLKGTVAGRFLWQLGTRTVDKLGLSSLQNCAACVVDEPIRPFTWAMDNLMLGCGVGFNIQREYVYKLPKVSDEFVAPTRNDTASADFIVPDSREGWVKLLEYTLRSAFDKSAKPTFSYSTQLIRGAGAVIKGFGGTASGPEILCWGIAEISNVLDRRKGKQLRPIDCLDIMCIIGGIVVAGNVRRSALIAIGDMDDFQYLRAKRWDLGNIPNYRSNANLSVVCNDISLLPDEVWKGYEGNGEPYGLINLKLSRKVGRTGDTRYPDKEVIGYNPCFTWHTPLLTSEGYRPIGSLEGQEVSIWNGDQWSKVTPFCTGINEIVRVSFTDGTVLECTPYHKFLVVDGFKNESATRIEAQSLVPGMKMQKWELPVVHPTITADGMYGDAYSQGFYSGDGSKDYEFSYLYEPKYCCENRLKGECVPDTAGRKRWKHGQMRDKSFVPVNDVTVNYKLNWLAGLLDSDGTLTSDENGNGFQICSVDFPFLERVKLMLNTLGVRAKIVSGHAQGIREMPDGKGGKRGYACQESHRLLIGNSDTYHLMTLGLKLNRLKAHANPPQRDARQYVRVKSVEWLGEEAPTYCVTEPLRNQMTVAGLVTGNCAEQSLANFETCCLAEVFLPNIESKEELLDVAKMLYRINKHSLNLPCHNKETEKIVHANQRMGIGVTGYLQATEEQRQWLPDCYEELRAFDKEYSASHGFPVSIKLTTTKPSGTLSLLPGVTPGFHPGYARYMIRRIRISSSHPLVQVVKDHGYHVEFAKNFDGTNDHSTVVAEFPFSYPEGTVLAKDLTAIDELEVVRRLQREWSDNAVSCTIYYRKEELPEIKKYLLENYNKNFKSISFLLHSGHGFVQAPMEEITEEEYNKLVKKTKLITHVGGMKEEELDQSNECTSGVCPIR